MRLGVRTSAVLPGINVLLDSHRDLLCGARVGIVAAAASVDASLRSVVDLLSCRSEFKVTALFGPEHGIRGAAQAGAPVASSVDRDTGLPVYSLYGAIRKPTAAMLKNVDLLVVDLFDVGCRYWTFLYTMAYTLQAATEHGKSVIVLDRPNPIGGEAVEGNILDTHFVSFVGLYPIPIRTGLTFGEAALLFNNEFNIGADLTVIPCAGWRREMWFDETGLLFVPPSPNTPTLDTLTLYPGTCLLEGTNLSEGRGTTRPFELIGAPWVDGKRLAEELNGRELPGVRFRPAYFTPTFSKYAGQLCAGVQIHVTERKRVEAVRVGLHLLHATKMLHPEFAWLPPREPDGRPFIDLLAGSAGLRTSLERGVAPEALLAEWERERAGFMAVRKQYLLYA